MGYSYSCSCPACNPRALLTAQPPSPKPNEALQASAANQLANYTCVYKRMFVCNVHKKHILLCVRVKLCLMLEDLLLVNR